MLSADVNFKGTTRFLNDVQRKQLPFATARALTWTAQDAQRAVIQHIKHRFVNRRAWYGKNQKTGIKIIRAEKKTKVQFAKVYTTAPWAHNQEEGGIRRPNSGKHLAIPTAKVPRNQWKVGGARNILKQKTTFEIPGKGIFKRVGPKGNKKLVRLFTYSKRATIRPALKLKQISRKVAGRRFQTNFNKSFGMAIKSAR